MFTTTGDTRLMENADVGPDGVGGVSGRRAQPENRSESPGEPADTALTTRLVNAAIGLAGPDDAVQAVVEAGRRRLADDDEVW
ncbi:MAG TPA: hypothetical protein VFX70_01515 [Mycobacteriales bacterium]|nr:hypothetical protein [Mycobacteriales bacterium]